MIDRSPSLTAPPFRKFAGASGFTLLELLVVMGVLAVLMAILIPVVSSARQSAGQAVCASNLRQWAIAVNLYSQSNRSWLPRRGQGTQPTQQLQWYDDWFNELPPLLQQPTYQTLVAGGQMPLAGSRSIWICPQLTGDPNRYGNLFGYAMNMALSPRIAPLPDRMDNVGSASDLVFMADAPAGYCSTVPYVSTPNAPALFNPSPRHRGRVNIAFLDAHVAAFTGDYLGCNTAGDPIHPDACNRPDVRWYWYVPGPTAPWGGP
jgi:prepilin-type N-terminal cleavage/methylation domain-containing protein/prepilin-type processing-associated H-X9-DG protein